MDTISSDNNDSFSYLPVLALIIGLIAGVLGGVALAKVSNIDKSLSEQSAVADRVDALETELRKTATAAENATTRINKVAGESNAAFKKFSNAFTLLRDSVEEMQKAPAPQPVASSAASQYVVKSGDTGSRIAHNAGVSLSALLNANPGVNWNRLAVGQAINIPAN